MRSVIRQFSLACAALLALSAAARGQTETPAAEAEALREQVRTIGTALAAANAENALQKEEAERLRLQMEALGVSAVRDGTRAIQERLIAAVRELRLAEQDKEQLAERLAKLSEAALAHSTGPSAESAKNLNQEIAEASRALGNARATDAPAVSIENAAVVSVKRDLGLAVINAGKDGGVRMGMPLKIQRGDSPVTGGIVIDLRDRIAGVLLTEAGAAGAAVGDSVRPEVTNSKQ